MIFEIIIKLPQFPHPFPSFKPSWKIFLKKRSKNTFPKVFDNSLHHLHLRLLPLLPHSQIALQGQCPGTSLHSFPLPASSMHACTHERTNEHTHEHKCTKLPHHPSLKACGRQEPAPSLPVLALVPGTWLSAFFCCGDGILLQGWGGDPKPFG